jgi:triosephosphate isomerase
MAADPFTVAGAATGAATGAGTDGMPSRRWPIVAGNWKMHKLRGEARAFCERLRAGLGAQPPATVLLFPSFPLLAEVAAALEGRPVAVGGQDLHPAEEGAHTGDVSGAQLIDAGCSWVLCGHSERRADHGESDELVGRKAEAALSCGLTPILCIGETAAQREQGETFDILRRQLEALFFEAPSCTEGGHFALAYEPVWAIGTGLTATPELAQEVHHFVRERLAEGVGEARAAATPILYGGSVKPDNAASLIAQMDIDGFLVGGASLDPEKFLAIIRQSAPAA